MNMTVTYAALAGVYFLIALALIIIILLQQKKSSGLGTMGGMGSAPQTYWDKNKGRSLEGRLHTYTKILATIMLVLTLVLAIV